MVVGVVVDVVIVGYSWLMLLLLLLLLFVLISAEVHANNLFLRF